MKKVKDLETSIIKNYFEMTFAEAKDELTKKSMPSEMKTEIANMIRNLSDEERGFEIISA